MKSKELNNRRAGALVGMNPYDDAFKEKEFNLSDKICGQGYKKIEEDVKEAVKKLKEEIKNNPPYNKDTFMIIDEIFGEELSQ